jgi:hypothetical protein
MLARTATEDHANAKLSQLFVCLRKSLTQITLTFNRHSKERAKPPST